MIRKFCDRCEKEVKRLVAVKTPFEIDIHALIEGEFKEYLSKMFCYGRYDLCSECAIEAARVMKNAAKEFIEGKKDE